jgi:hypothetical protein
MFWKTGLPPAFDSGVGVGVGFALRRARPGASASVRQRSDSGALVGNRQWVGGETCSRCTSSANHGDRTSSDHTPDGVLHTDPRPRGPERPQHAPGSGAGAVGRSNLQRTRSRDAKWPKSGPSGPISSADPMRCRSAQALAVPLGLAIAYETEAKSGGTLGSLMRAAPDRPGAARRAAKNDGGWPRGWSRAKSAHRSFRCMMCSPTRPRSGWSNASGTVPTIENPTES